MLSGVLFCSAMIGTFLLVRVKAGIPRPGVLKPGVAVGAV